MQVLNTQNKYELEIDMPQQKQQAPPRASHISPILVYLANPSRNPDSQTVHLESMMDKCKFRSLTLKTQNLKCEQSRRYIQFYLSRCHCQLVADRSTVERTALQKQTLLKAILSIF